MPYDIPYLWFWLIYTNHFAVTIFFSLPNISALNNVISGWCSVCFVCMFSLIATLWHTHTYTLTLAYAVTHNISFCLSQMAYIYRIQYAHRVCWKALCVRDAWRSTNKKHFDNNKWINKIHFYLVRTNSKSSNRLQNTSKRDKMFKYFFLRCTRHSNKQTNKATQIMYACIHFENGLVIFLSIPLLPRPTK